MECQFRKPGVLVGGGHGGLELRGVREDEVLVKDRDHGGIHHAAGRAAECPGEGCPEDAVRVVPLIIAPPVADLVAGTQKERRVPELLRADIITGIVIPAPLVGRTADDVFVDAGPSLERDSDIGYRLAPLERAVWRSWGALPVPIGQEPRYRARAWGLSVL